MLIRPISLLADRLDGREVGREVGRLDVRELGRLDGREVGREVERLDVRELGREVGRLNGREAGRLGAGATALAIVFCITSSDTGTARGTTFTSCGATSTGV